MSEDMAAAICKGVRVPHSPFLNAARIQRMTEARYEGDEIRGALSVIRPEDRVLELGAGLGVVGAVIAKNAAPQAVLSFEANPNLIPHINMLYAANGLQARIEVRHQVVLSGADCPQAVDFHLYNSYLGSSLIDNPARETRRVSVPAVRFQDVCAAFKPTVLVMDIEGGELDFLQHADLSTIRALVIEFHPKAYGRRGTQTCKDILRKAGFVKDAEVSTRFVWTVERPEMRAPLAEPPQPDQGWSQCIRELKTAIVAPAKGNALSMPSGVVDAGGEDVPEAALWRKQRRLNLPFETPSDVDPLKGRWLWGGVHWNNFAHLITEGLSRLWALEQVDGSLDGILFIPRRASQNVEIHRLHRDLFQTLGIDLPIRIANSPLQVERLLVPGQGFGIGPISKGTPAFRAFMANRFGADIAPEGGPRLYISRARLGPHRGALLGEDRIEAELATHGYETFYPEQHDFRTQIARYKAAKEVIAVEGSALHFLAHVGHQGQRVAVIGRRRSSATNLMLTHIEAFTGQTPVYMDTLRSIWTRKSSRRTRMSVGEPDMGALQAALAKAGFIASGPKWDALDAGDVQAVLQERYQQNLVAAA